MLRSPRAELRKTQKVHYFMHSSVIFIIPCITFNGVSAIKTYIIVKAEKEDLDLRVVY